jgi:DNA-binding PadR family transcriptional regulator
LQSNQPDLPDGLRQLAAELNLQNSHNATKRVKFDNHPTADRGKQLDTKEADRKTIIDIVAEMHQKTTDFVKCLDIEKEATKRGISKPTFYRRLTELTKEGTLEKKEISHRDTRYRVSYAILPGGQKQVLLFKQEALAFINTRLRETEAKQDELEVLKELGRWLGALSLYCLYKEIQTGYPFTEAVIYYLHEQPRGAPHYLRKSVVYGSKAPDMLDDLGKLAKAMTDEPLGKNEKFGLGLGNLFETLKKIYPKEFDAFSMLWEYIMFGQVSWPPEWRIEEEISRQKEAEEKETQKKTKGKV